LRKWVYLDSFSYIDYFMIISATKYNIEGLHAVCIRKSVSEEMTS
jgi:hypothetical protein